MTRYVNLSIFKTTHTILAVIGVIVALLGAFVFPPMFGMITATVIWVIMLRALYSWNFGVMYVVGMAYPLGYLVTAFSLDMSDSNFWQWMAWYCNAFAGMMIVVESAYYYRPKK